MKCTAVIFDLFGTLVENYSLQKHNETLQRMATVLGVPPDEFIKLWFDTYSERFTGVFPNADDNIVYICKKIGVSVTDTQIKRAAAIRLDLTKRWMIPRDGAIETLTRLKSEGYKIGLISDCSGEVPSIWKSTPFAPLIDVAVFSCVVRMKKPDPGIFLLATERLGVTPQNCLYIGDGNSRELTGASQVGMYAVLLRIPDIDSSDEHQIEKEEWHGPAISSLPEVLALVSSGGLF